MKQFERLDRLIDDLKDMDAELTNASSKSEVDCIIKSGNHYLLRHIAINTAIVTDLLDRVISEELHHDN